MGPTPPVPPTPLACLPPPTHPGQGIRVPEAVVELIGKFSKWNENSSINNLSLTFQRGEK